MSHVCYIGIQQIYVMFLHCFVVTQRPNQSRFDSSTQIGRFLYLLRRSHDGPLSFCHPLQCLPRICTQNSLQLCLHGAAHPGRQSWRSEEIGQATGPLIFCQDSCSYYFCDCCFSAAAAAAAAAAVAVLLLLLSFGVRPVTAAGNPIDGRIGAALSEAKSSVQWCGLTVGAGGGLSKAEGVGGY